MTAASALRTVIVDDSALARLMLRDAIKGIEGVRVVANASDGMAALELISEIKPGLIILDVEMPGMNGLELLREMKLRGLEIPVLMCSRLTIAGAEVTTEALLQGAYDFVCKPSTGNRQDNVQSLRADIAQRIGPLIEAVQSADRGEHAVEELRPVPEPANSLVGVTVDAVLIGASTGGPAALHSLLGRLDPLLHIPILIVQHIPAGYSEPLARRLTQASTLPVVEACDGQAVEGGTIYLARGGRHLKIEGTYEGAVLRLADCPPLNGCRPSVDVMFDSACSYYGDRCLAVILTGMGRDGAQGAKAIRAAGGIVFAQQPETCTVSSMPRQTIGIAGADRVADLPHLAELINSIAARQ
jgi:two-component system chemotaxis response regulator CheB